MVRIIMHGCNGKMGQVITGLVADDPNAQIVAGIDIADNRDNGYPVFTDIKKCDVAADVIVDFAAAVAVDALLDYSVEKQIPVVLCTTGLSDEQDIIIKAAAVADYRPKQVSEDKVKKKDDQASIELERTDDILKYLGQHKKQGQFLCGFSMETRDMLRNSRAKLEKKNLDMVAANNLKVEGAGFQGDTNVLTLITQDEEVSLPLMSKEDAALKILDKILLLTTKAEA